MTNVSAPGSSIRRGIVKAGHNNILVTDYPLYATMAEWFLKYLKQG